MFQRWIMPALDKGEWPIRNNSPHPPLDIAPLDRVGWLAQQDSEFRDWAARCGQWREYAAGQFVYHAGDPSDGLHGLAAGGLEITFPLLAEEPVIIHRAEIGFWIGENAELSATPRVVSLRAASPSRLLHLPGRTIRALLVDHPEHWRAFYRLSSTNVATAITLLSEALALTVRARVCRRLLRLADGAQEAKITQDELGRLVGAPRTTLRRCLADLAERGGVSLRYRRVQILDAAVLALFKDEQ
jgi:CRP-like cAMP-binding protein